MTPFLSKAKNYCWLALSALLIFPHVVFAQVDINKSFSPNTISPTEPSALTITLQNFSTSPAINASFTDVFPNNLFVEAVPNATNDCGGTVNFSNGGERWSGEFGGRNYSAWGWS